MRALLLRLLLVLCALGGVRSEDGGDAVPGVHYGSCTIDVDSTACEHRAGGIFPALHASTQGRSGGCVDIATPEVLDLTCSYAFAEENFHKLASCFVPAFGLVERALAETTRNVTVLVPSFLEPHAAFFLATAAHATVLPYQHPLSQHRRTCFTVPPAARLSYEAFALAGSREHWAALQNIDRVQALAVRMRSQAARLLAQRGLAHAEPAVTVTIINRVGGARRWADVAALRGALLAAAPRARVHLYNGTESYGETLALFSQSDMVIGFHGAGHVNSLYCAGGAVIVEVTTEGQFDCPVVVAQGDPEPRTEQLPCWRCNRHTYLAIHPALRWDIVRLPLAQLRFDDQPRFDAADAAAQQYLLEKAASRVVLEQKELQLIASLVPRKKASG